MTTGSYAHQVGALMRQERARRDWSLADVEEKSGGRWRSAVIGSYERGQRNILMEDLDEYARWLGVPVTSLLPAEPGSRNQIARLAWEVARDAVTELTAVLGRYDSVAVRELLKHALSDTNGDAA